MIFIEIKTWMMEIWFFEFKVIKVTKFEGLLFEVYTLEYKM